MANHPPPPPQPAAPAPESSARCFLNLNSALGVLPPTQELGFPLPPANAGDITDQSRPYAADLAAPGFAAALSYLGGCLLPPPHVDPAVALEESSVSDLISGGNSDGNARKRKVPAPARGKGKDAHPRGSLKETTHGGEGATDSHAKRRKVATAKGVDAEPLKSADDHSGGEQDPKTREATRDYVYVRAKRGQATDSHSLAERVRRERVNQRMKVLQDLVPGCDKVNSKALMLDEIINYVQSLQRQVEFLSMKLATLNPQMDLTANLHPRDMYQACRPMLRPPIAYDASCYPFGQNGDAFHPIALNCIEDKCSLASLSSGLSQSHSGSSTPILQRHFVDADLTNVFHVKSMTNHDARISSESFTVGRFEGQAQATDMKTEF